MTEAPLVKAANRYSEAAIEDEVVVMSLENGNFFSMTGPARTVWDLIDGSRGYKAILREITGIYSGEEGQIASDLGAFIDQLIAAGLIIGG